MNDECLSTNDERMSKAQMPKGASLLVIRSLRHSFVIRISSFVIFLIAAQNHAFACAACFGQSDSKMAQSMNAGIFSLLTVVVTVLITGASFFIFLARKAAAVARAEQAKQSLSTQV